MVKVKELCELIKVCGEAGVAELKFADLHVTFVLSKAPDEVALGYEQPIIKDESEAEVILRDEVKLKEDQLDLALIERPGEYERMLMSGELEDEKADD